MSTQQVATDMARGWRMLRPRTWRRAVAVAAESALGEQWKRWDPPQNPICDDELLRLDEALEMGALIGFALARTWPADVAQLGEWPARALAFAGIEP